MTPSSCRRQPSPPCTHAHPRVACVPQVHKCWTQRWALRTRLPPTLQVRAGDDCPAGNHLGTQLPSSGREDGEPRTAGTGPATFTTGPASNSVLLPQHQGQGSPLLFLFLLTNSQLGDISQLRYVLVLYARTGDLSAVTVWPAGTALPSLPVPTPSGTSGGLLLQLPKADTLRHVGKRGKVVVTTPVLITRLPPTSRSWSVLFLSSLLPSALPLAGLF